MNNIKVIAFDADDTLWVNEPYFREAEAKYAKLLSRFGDRDYIENKLYEIEIKNLSCYGYGAKAFTLSLIECATKLSKENPLELQLTVDEISEIVEIGTYLIKVEIELLEGVEDTLVKLSKNFRLVVATKGDLLDQQQKLERSGLKKYFSHVEVMSNKTSADYQNLIKLLDVEPNEFLMVGNSLKSDIIPVLEIGGFAVHIPFHTTWQHEEIDEDVIHPNFYVVSDMGELSYVI